MCGIFGLLALGAASVSAEPAAPQPGLVAHYYGETTFFMHGGSLVTPGLALELKSNQLKWPANNWDAAKGPVFTRGGGWSLACRGALAVSVGGEYRFKVEGPEVALQVDGLVTATDGGRGLFLKPGSHSIVLYWKSNAGGVLTRDVANVRVQWQPPGQPGFEDVPDAALSHGVADLSEELACRPGISFDQVEPGINNQRELPFEIKEAGLYELAAHLRSIPRIFQLWLDGEPLFYVQGQRAGITEQRLDYLGRARAVRHLTRGRHVATVFGHYGPWVWDDEMDLVLKSIRIGATRVKEADLGGSLGIRLEEKPGKGRSDLVFRKGEPLVVHLEQNTGAVERVSMEVKEQRGDGRILWTGSANLAGGKLPATAELRYVCDRQGAFEYTIKDGAGKTVDGPWAFVVVDATPVAPVRTGAAPAELKGEIVDRVDCALPVDAAHKFRDNGTSQVVESATGSYRVTGTNLLRPIGYVEEGKTWRRAKEGEKGVGPDQYSADWFAYTMKVKNPGKPHLLVAYVPNDVRRLVSVQAFDQVTGSYNGWCLEAGDAPEAGPFSKLTFVIWPNGDAIDVLTWCSNNNHGSKLNRQGAVAKFELMELADGLPAAPAPVGGYVPQREAGWEGEQVNLGIVERTTPPLWEGNDFIPGSLANGVYPGAAYCDWRTLLTAWDRFGELSGFRGDNLCVAPVYTYGMTCMQGVPHLPKCWDVYSSGYRARVVDPIERDIFKMMLLVAEKHNLRMVADFMVHRLENALPPFARAMGCTNMDGIFVTDAMGKVLHTVSNNQMLNPAHPVARKYFLTVIDEIATRYGAFPAFAGIKIRQWTGWPSAMDAWYINEQNGYDDFTVALFEKETGKKVAVEEKGDTRFGLRQKILLGELRVAWLDWRCKKVESLLEEAVAVLRRHAPKAQLYSGITAGGGAGTAPLNRGGGLDLQKLAGKRDLGFGPHSRFGGEGVEWNYPDPIDFANFDIREPASLRRTMENFHPNNGFNYPIGMCCADSFRSHPYQLEEPAKALANNNLEMFTYGPQWCLPPIDDGFRRFVQVFRTIPVLPYTRFAGQGSGQSVAVCWSAVRPRSGGGGGTVFYLVNQTAKVHDVEIAFEGPVKSVTNLVDANRLTATNGVVRIHLDPFMPAVFGMDDEGSIKSLNVVASPAEVEAARQRVESLKVIRAHAGATRHLFALPAGTQDGGWEGSVSEAFDETGASILQAWQAGQSFQADYLLDRMLAERTWWFEAFGWPVGADSKRQPTGILGKPEALAKNLKAEGASNLTEIAPFKGKFLVVPSGKVVWNAGITGGVYELRAWGLMGGGYGPIKVLVDGKEAGRIGVNATRAHPVQFVLPQALALAPGGRRIELVAEGDKGLALSALELAVRPPAPIKGWSVIGLFDKGTPSAVPRQGGADGMETIFPPEEKLDLKAAYPGMGGREIRWRQVEIGNDPFLKLLDKVFPGAPGNGVAYLATWVRSPEERDAVLYYAMDWFGKVWLNDQVVLPHVSGPWKSFITQRIHLKAGWNTLLVKTARGNEGWMANFAVSDPGDLQYSPTPGEALPK